LISAPKPVERAAAVRQLGQQLERLAMQALGVVELHELRVALGVEQRALALGQIALIRTLEKRHQLRRIAEQVRLEQRRVENARTCRSSARTAPRRPPRRPPPSRRLLIHTQHHRIAAHAS
jgi:hypothetical protein